ncbi:MAG: hypothetical protein AMJ79_13250 [Phycisphaerae bacterium SM23_30]|nr:MAG: hypothetical protein AMJ79_13250 [Phycisphaerae bacterium SM23_30]
MSLAVKETSNGVIFMVKVLPASSRTAVAGLQGDALKVNLAAPAAKGKANKALIALLAEVLGRPKTDVLLRRGERNRRKEIYVADMTGRQLRKNLADYLK